MRILYFTRQIYLQGGIERVLTLKANYLAQLPGIEVFIVTSNQGNKKPRFPLDKKVNFIDLGINYNLNKRTYSPRNIWRTIIHFFRQRRLLRQLKPDVIISIRYSMDQLWLPIINQNAKLIREWHQSRYNYDEIRKKRSYLKRCQYILYDWLDKKYDHIVVLNEDEKKYVKSDNGTVIPNPISRYNMNTPLDKMRVLAAGRFVPDKAFDELIKIWNIVHQKYRDWELHIFGNDPSNAKEKLNNLILDLNLSSSVHLKDSTPDLIKIMEDYSIYALSSKTDCFPMVLLESLSVGLPIVSYDCPNGPRHIIRDGEDGILIEQGNREKFALAIGSLIEDKNLRRKMSNRAKENVQRFEMVNVMKQWLNLLNS